MIPNSDLWTHIQHLEIDADDDDFLECAVVAYSRNSEIFADVLGDICYGFEKSLHDAIDGDDAELGRRLRLLWRNYCRQIVRRDRDEIISECRALLRQAAQDGAVYAEIKQMKESA
jgi:hypothetical protein